MSTRVDDQTIHEFRANVQRVFSEGLGITFVPGRLQGPNQWGDWLGSCLLSRIREVPGRVLEQEIVIVIRVFAPFSSQGSLSPNEPYDPTPLEEMAERVLAVAAANQTGLGAWFQRVTGLEIDPDAQGIELMLLAYSANQALT